MGQGPHPARCSLPMTASSSTTIPTTRPRTGPLVACLVIFLTLGGMVHFVSGRGHKVPPLALNEDLLPLEIDGFTYAGQEPGWTSKGYPAGETLFRYTREGGATMLVTAGASQQRDLTFANVSTTHSQRGHELVATPTTQIGPGLVPAAQTVELGVYAPSKEAPGFAFLGLYWDGHQLTDSVVHAKMSVTWHRALGRPVPWVAVYFGRLMDEGETNEAAAAELAEFATAFMPTVEELRKAYVDSAR